MTNERGRIVCAKTMKSFVNEKQMRTISGFARSKKVIRIFFSPLCFQGNVTWILRKNEVY